MKRPAMKTADDVIVSDPDAAMRRTEQAVRHALSLPKSALAKLPRAKRGKKK